MFEVGTTFETIAAAKHAITIMLLDAGLSYTAYKSDKTRLILKCRDKECSFYLRAAYSKAQGKVLLVTYKAHECGLETHHGFKERRRVKYLKGIHTSAILSDRAKATPGTEPLLISQA